MLAHQQFGPPWVAGGDRFQNAAMASRLREAL
jgi:hypothetical protein